VKNANTRFATAHPINGGDAEKMTEPSSAGFTRPQGYHMHQYSPEPLQFNGNTNYYPQPYQMQTAQYPVSNMGYVQGFGNYQGNNSFTQRLYLKH
jgi:hypothetical protein